MAPLISSSFILSNLHQRATTFSYLSTQLHKSVDLNLTLMASSEKGRALPKFGEWDVNDPASADGFTVIFNKARDKKTGAPSENKKSQASDKDNGSSKRKWFSCF